MTTKPAARGKLLTIAEVAEQLRCSQRSIRRIAVAQEFRLVVKYEHDPAATEALVDLLWRILQRIRNDG